MLGSKLLLLVRDVADVSLAEGHHVTAPPPPTELAVSTVIFALRNDTSGQPRLSLPLVRRVRTPFKGAWALPGGPLRFDEDLAQAAARNLSETTGLGPRYLEQLYAFGQPDRSPGGRVVSIVYWALVGGDEAAGTWADDNVRWFDVADVPDLAFDHGLILDYALWRLRNKWEYSRLAPGLLGPTFTLAQLRRVYEAVLQRRLDPGNFRRMVEGSGQVVATGERLAGARHRPPQLYRFNSTLAFFDQDPLAPHRLADHQGLAS